MEKRKTKQGESEALLKNSAKATVLSLAVTFALVFLEALAVSAGTVTETLTDSLLVSEVLIAETIGGLYCAKRQGSGVITAGALSSGLYVVIAVLITMLLPKAGEGDGLLLKLIIASVAGGTFGGVLRLKRTTTKSKLRKR